MEQKNKYSKYLNIDFVWDNESIGLNCVSFVRKIFEEQRNVKVNHEYMKGHSLKLVVSNPTIVVDELRKLFKEVKFGRDCIQQKDLEEGDILLFRFWKYDCHLGYYIGDGCFLTVTEHRKSDFFNLSYSGWNKRLIGAYRWQ